MITAEVVADSLNTATEDRITTMLLTYPRFIHAELLTHRLFSRNSASSRAIPIERMIMAVEANPAMPVEWGTNQKGMQAGQPLSGDLARQAQAAWLDAARQACEAARTLANLGLHKQVANRVLEPFMHMTCLVTATEWANFFHLRCSPLAQPELQALADLMLDRYVHSTPVQRKIDDWHLPFADSPIDAAELPINRRLQISAARCARTSYTRQSETSWLEDDIRVHNKLVENGHWSPLEHQAKALDEYEAREYRDVSNFQGWHQYRHTFKGQHVDHLDLRALHQQRQEARCG